MTHNAFRNSSHVHLRKSHSLQLPVEFANDDVRFAESFVEFALARFSAPGDRILDPFAGFGTTLAIAERAGREAWGIEINARRADYARSLLERPERLLTADARILSSLQLPEFDLALTSPPYMSEGDVEDPVSGYANPGRGYGAYLDDLVNVFRAVGERVKPGARILVEVARLRNGERVTTLAWDLGLRLACRHRYKSHPANRELSRSARRSPRPPRAGPASR